MAKKGKKVTRLSTNLELMMQTRGSWHGVNPVTKTVPAKKGKGAPYKRKPKHAKLED